MVFNSWLVNTTDYHTVGAPEGQLKESLKVRLGDVMSRAEDLKGIPANSTPLLSMCLRQCTKVGRVAQQIHSLILF